MLKTIFIVESDSTVKSMVRYSLANQNYLIQEAATRKEALEKLECIKNPGLIIIGLTHPGVSSVELVNEIRGFPALRFVPILMLASEDTLGSQMEWKEAGATCWITKPFTQEELKEMIELLDF